MQIYIIYSFLRVSSFAGPMYELKLILCDPTEPALFRVLSPYDLLVCARVDICAHNAAMLL